MYNGTGIMGRFSRYSMVYSVCAFIRRIDIIHHRLEKSYLNLGSQEVVDFVIFFQMVPLN